MRVDLDGGHLQAAFLLPGRVEPLEEPPERRTLGLDRERPRDVGEGVEVGPGARRVVPRAGKHLDVETEHAFGLPDEVGERQPGEQPEALHRRVEPPQPLTGDVGEVLAVAPTP